MRRRLDKSDRDEMRKLRRRGLSLTAIAAAIDCSKSAVHRAVQDMEVDGRIAANRERAAIQPAWLPRAQRMLAKGLARFAIARELGVPKTVVYRWLK